MTDWEPKGPRNYAIASRRNVFPLDGESQTPKSDVKEVVKADFQASDSEETDGIIEAVKSIDPYLHPKNQVLLRALIKVNSLVRDVGNLKNYKSAEVQGQAVVKPLSFKEGLNIAREMGPYLAPGTRKQVESLFEGITRVSHLKNNIVKVQNAESTDIRVDYILESVKPFVAFEKYNQIKQLVNVMKIFQTTREVSSEINSQDSDGEVNEQDQLSDIIGLLDKFGNKNSEAE